MTFSIDSPVTYDFTIFIHLNSRQGLILNIYKNSDVSSVSILQTGVITFGKPFIYIRYNRGPKI